MIKWKLEMNKKAKTKTISSIKLDGSLEKLIMQCLWDHHENTVKQVHICLNKQRPIAYTTVMTVMTRLVDKGLLTRQRKGRYYIYQPNMSKYKFLKQLFHQVMTSTFDRYGATAITAFVSEINKVSKDKKIELLRKLKDSLDD